MSALSARIWLPVLLSLVASCAWMRPSAPEYPRIERGGGLVIRDLVVPEAGAEVDSGDAVAIHYQLWLSDHTLVESSLDSGQPLRFEIGQGQVLPGLEQGLLGMRLYGSRRIVVPPELGYGSEGRPPLIPGDSTLTFDVELMEHEPR
jgi:FKBP-type peptidyl-prolyl cis-trans isomerase